MFFAQKITISSVSGISFESQEDEEVDFEVLFEPDCEPVWAVLSDALAEPLPLAEDAEDWLEEEPLLETEPPQPESDNKAVTANANNVDFLMESSYWLSLL